VLLVEDEAVVRAMAAEALRDVGCHVLEAGDGPEALRLLDQGNVPDILVTDVGLPGGLNGRQVADAVRERHAGLPTLLITGYAGGALEGQLAPGMKVLTKPFPLASLVEMVQRIVVQAEAPPC
jgi:CheY-like chemotaxis protein